MKWLVQTNFGKDSRIEDFISALKKAKVDYAVFDYLSHSNKLPKLLDKDYKQTFLYGSTQVIELASKTEKWKDSLFFNETNFCYEAWAKNYASLLLNDPKDTALMKISDFETWATNKDHEQMMFIRPNKDLKEFNGQVFSVSAFLTWAKDVVQGGYATVSKDTEIAVSIPHGIDAEYRIFMQDNGQIIAYSQYKKKGRIHMDLNIPQHVLDKASEIAKVWSPSKLFTLDLALSGDNLWIVEAQSIHSSGFYDSDLDKYVKNIESFYGSHNLKSKVKNKP